jgi:transposase InsO family protein
MSPVVDYAAKLAFACHVTATKTAGDAVAAMEAALAEAERLLGFRLIEDCRDPMSGEVYPLILVTDNGSAYRADSFARFIAAHRELAHVRTRYRAPWTNGVVERFNESAKYEYLYREEVAGGHQLAHEVEVYRRLYVEVRPHENLAFRVPLDVYLAAPAEPPIPVADFRRSTLGYLEPILAVAPTADGVESPGAAGHPAPLGGLTALPTGTRSTGPAG